jgi:glyoxylase-like metal-dependent hydrolase (beta-lactamase superfamily II)
MLRFAPLVLATLLSPQDDGAASRPVDVTRSAMLEQVRAAVEMVRAAESRGPKLARGFSAVYEGDVLLEAHDRLPGQRRRTPVRIAIDCAGPGRFAIRETTGRPGRVSTETTLVEGSQVARQGSERAPFKELTGSDAAAGLASAQRWFPALALSAALRERASCRPGAAVKHDGVILSPLTFTDASGHACTLLLDGGGRLARVESLAAHPRLGDVSDWTRFEKYELRGEVEVPTRLLRFDVAASVTIEYELELRSFRDGPPPPERVGAPESRRSEIPGFGARPDPMTGFEVVGLAPGLWAVEIAAADARVLVIERESDLVLIDAPDGDDVTVALLRALAARFPDKPVRLAAFGHHHPSHSGGLRAIAASGATIVAPKGLEAHLRGLLARPVTLGAPAVAGPSEPSFQLFEGQTRIEAGPSSVMLLDIADRSAHAFHFVVFYFPESGILFEDDLGWFPEKGNASWSPRLAGLGVALAEARIAPKRLVQAWPVKGAKREVPWPEVQDLIDRPPSRPASR